MDAKSSYEQRIVAFVDILGFSSILDKTQSKGEDGKLEDNETYIQTLVSVFERIADLMQIDEPYEDSAPSRQATQFSDSIVISFKLEEARREFRYLLEELLFLHIELLRHGILIRGGISYGPLVHTNKVLFGPAMVQAYRVESSAANSPRIIIPKSLHDISADLGKPFSTREAEYDLDALVSLDEDDFFYLDYFDKCQRPELRLFANDQEYIDHMKTMKKMIVENLRTTNPGIYSKYGWMKSKWNRVVEKYKSTGSTLHKEGRNELARYFQEETIIQTAM